MMDDILRQLAETLERRKSAAPEESYVAALHEQGVGRILEKVTEEAAETVQAAVQGDSKAVVHETADLWFHTLVMLSLMGLGPDDILNELRRRFGTSGHAEKASRESVTESD